MNPVLARWFFVFSFMTYHCESAEVSCIYQDCWKINHWGSTVSVRNFLFSSFAFILIQMLKRHMIPTEISFPFKAGFICTDLHGRHLSFFRILSVAFLVASHGWPRHPLRKISQILKRPAHHLCFFQCFLPYVLLKQVWGPLDLFVSVASLKS